MFEWVDAIVGALVGASCTKGGQWLMEKAKLRKLAKQAKRAHDAHDALSRLTRE